MMTQRRALIALLVFYGLTSSACLISLLLTGKPL
jgi:hypothetical protein